MKKPVKLSEFKSVRIDSKTIILVKREVPDDLARNNFLNNMDRSFRLTQRCGIGSSKKKKDDEIDLPNIEEKDDGEEDQEETSGDI